MPDGPFYGSFALPHRETESQAVADLNRLILLLKECAPDLVPEGMSMVKVRRIFDE